MIYTAWGEGRKALSLTLDGSAVQEEAVSLRLTEDRREGDSLSLGTAVPSRLELELRDTKRRWLGGRVTASLAGVPLGSFTVTEAETREGRTVLRAVDALGAELGAAYVPEKEQNTALGVLREICAACGVPAGDLSGVRDVPVSGLGGGHSCREMAGHMAALLGRNVRMDRQGRLSLCWYAPAEALALGDVVRSGEVLRIPGTRAGETFRPEQLLDPADVTADRYYAGGLAAGERDVTLGGLRCEAVREKIVTETGSDGLETVREERTSETLTAGGAAGPVLLNPFMTRPALERVFREIGGMTWRPMTVTLYGDARIEAGDILRVRDGGGTVLTLPVTEAVHIWDGGVKTVLTAADLPASDGTAAGTLTAAVSRLSGTVDQLREREANNLAVTNVRLERLTADQAAFGVLLADKADIEDLTAANAEIQSLKTGKADVGDLTAANAEIQRLKTGKADVKDLTAASAEIQSLKTDKADLSLLRANYATLGALEAVDGKFGSLSADYARVDFGNVDLAELRQGFARDFFVSGGLVTEDATAVTMDVTRYLTGVTIQGDVIRAATVRADRLILTGSDGLVYELNAAASGLSSAELTEEQYREKLAGTVLAARSVTADRLKAASITGNEIAANTITAGNIRAGTVTGTEIAAGTITGANIAGGTVTARHLTVGDLQNYVTVTEKVPASMLPADHPLGGTVTSGGYVEKAAAAGDILALSGLEPNGFACGDELRYELTARGSGTARLVLMGFGEDGSLLGRFASPPLALDGTDRTFSGTLRLTDAEPVPGGAETLFLRSLGSGETLCLETALGAAYLSGTETLGLGRSLTGWDRIALAVADTAGRRVRVRNASVRRRWGGVLIADGAVTAEKLAAGCVTADKIDVGDLRAVGARIGGFAIGERDIHSGMTGLDAPGPGVYLGTDGVALGGGTFRVDADGRLTARDAELTGGVTTDRLLATGGSIGGLTITEDAIGANGLVIREDGGLNAVTGTFGSFNFGSTIRLLGGHTIQMTHGSITDEDGYLRIRASSELPDDVVVEGTTRIDGDLSVGGGVDILEGLTVKGAPVAGTVTLWTNPAPAEAFSAQNVSVPRLSDCDMVYVGFGLMDSSANTRGGLWLRFGSNVIVHGALELTDYETGTRYVRKATLSKPAGKVLFSAARAFAPGGGTEDGGPWCIPQVILGLKS